MPSVVRSGPGRSRSVPISLLGPAVTDGGLSSCRVTQGGPLDPVHAAGASARIEVRQGGGDHEDGLHDSSSHRSRPDGGVHLRWSALRARLCLRGPGRWEGGAAGGSGRRRPHRPHLPPAPARAEGPRACSRVVCRVGRDRARRRPGRGAGSPDDRAHPGPADRRGRADVCAARSCWLARWTVDRSPTPGSRPRSRSRRCSPPNAPSLLRAQPHDEGPGGRRRSRSPPGPSDGRGDSVQSQDIRDRCLKTSATPCLGSSATRSGADDAQPWQRRD